MAGECAASVKAVIAPSVLACDFGNLASECQKVVDGGADWLHLDVMDGNFVPNISFGVPVIESLRKHSASFFDCHLMVANPEFWVDTFAAAGANQYTFHIEATENPVPLIAKIREKGMKVGIALKPKTAVEAVFPYVGSIDTVLVMTVEPGFGGQKFMSDMMPKVRALREKFPNADIQVDGGLGPSNIEEAANAGANIIVAGTSVFRAPEAAPAITALRSAVEAALTGKRKSCE